MATSRSKKHQKRRKRSITAVQPGVPRVRESFVQKAAASTALLSSFLLSTLALIAFLFTRAYLERTYGADSVHAAVTIYGVLLGAGGVMIVCATLAARWLTRRLAEPLLHVSRAVARLRPGHWTYRRSVRSGDEVEVLDAVADDLARRLKRVYEHLEEEVRQRTEEVKEQYEMDRTILQSIQHGVLVVDAKGNVASANPAALEMLQKGDDEVLERNVTEVLVLRRHSGPVSDTRHPVRVCLHTRAPVDPGPAIHLSMQGPDILLPIILTVSPVLRGRKLLGAVAVFRDVTEERKVDYLKSEFISLASHQLRTPMSTVQWYLELLLDQRKGLTARQLEYLGEINRASRRMTDLVDALLRVARLEGGAITPTWEPIDLREFAADLKGELCALARDRKIACDAKMPARSMVLQTDPVLLRVVFQNLFSNACKYTKPGGTVSLLFSLRRGSVQMSVKDTGVGIPKRAQKRIFEKLFRAENVKRMDTDGSGLGLYITQIIVRSLGGSISFRSGEGKGTTFLVDLPQRPPADRTKNGRRAGKLKF